MPIPRKLASSTKLVALVTYTLFAVTQRIRASSTNNIRKLAKISRAWSPGRLSGAAAGCFASTCLVGWSLLAVSISAMSALSSSESFPVSTVQP